MYGRCKICLWMKFNLDKMTKSNCNLCKYLCIIPGLAVYRLRDVFNLRGAGSSLLTVGIICVISNKAELLDFSDSNNNTQGSHSRGDIMTHGDSVIGDHWPPGTRHQLLTCFVSVRHVGSLGLCNPVSDCCVKIGINLTSHYCHADIILTSPRGHQTSPLLFSLLTLSWVVNDGFNSEAGQGYLDS